LKFLSHNLKNILPKIEKSDRIVLFLDYDGTLTPIVKSPDKAFLSSSTRKILKELSDNRKITVSIVSGRSLQKIKKLVALDNIYYAGCHGMEIEYAGKTFVVPDAKKSLPILKRLKKKLRKELCCIKNVEIEDKGLVLAIHYRNVRKGCVLQLKKIFSENVRPYLYSKKIRIANGKKVIEVRPPVDWDKGRYCLYLLKKLERKGKSLLPVYIGDDETDETCFKALRRSGVTIFVKGEKRSSQAVYYLNSPAEVRALLKGLSLLFRT